MLSGNYPDSNTHVAMKPEMYNGCIMIIVHIIAHSYHNYCTLFLFFSGR